MFKRHFWTILIVTLWVILLPSMAHSISYNQVRKIAEETTVLIDGCGAGSGILYKKDKDLYSVITAKHVVENAQLTCLVITQKDRYPIESNSTRFLPNNVDLAVVKFRSSKRYKLAQFGESQGVKIGDKVYVSGAPQASQIISQRKVLVTEGKILEFQDPQEGYEWIYNSLTRKGMSGGGVFNEEGKVIGIHGKGDDIAGDKLNIGIPIQTFLFNIIDRIDKLDNRLMKFEIFTVSIFFVGISIGIIYILCQIYVTIKNLETNSFFKRLVYLLFKSLLGGGLAFMAFFLGFIGLFFYDNAAFYYSMNDYNKTIELDPIFVYAYNNRGNVYYDQKQYELALADYNKTIELDPNYANAYNNRGSVYYDQKQYELALADYNKAIELDPNYAYAYNNRGNVYRKQKQYELALADYTKAFQLDPNDQTIRQNFENLKRKIN